VRPILARSSAIAWVLALGMVLCMQLAHANVVPPDQGATRRSESGTSVRELINAVEWVGVDGNILRLQTELAFDTTLAGVANRDVRQALAARVIEQRGDQFDFVLVLTSFPFRLEFEDLLANGLYWQIANDVDGIGLGRFDQSTNWGSAGRLQGFIDLGEASPDRLEAGSFGYQFLLETATHELMHRWASYVRYRDGQGAVRDDLLGHLDTHWNTLLNNGASVMYGHDWRESEPGVFESGPVRRTYSELDLYLAGFMAASEVSPLELLRTSATDLPELPQAGLVTQGELDFVDLARVIDHEGPRVPSAPCPGGRRPTGDAWRRPAASGDRAWLEAARGQTRAARCG